MLADFSVLFVFIAALAYGRSCVMAFDGTWLLAFWKPMGTPFEILWDLVDLWLPLVELEEMMTYVVPGWARPRQAAILAPVPGVDCLSLIGKRLRCCSELPLWDLFAVATLGSVCGSMC